MNMPKDIFKARFLEYGKKAPKGSRFKGILTTESIIGFFDYTSDKEKAEESMKKESSDKGFLGYTSREGGLRTYTKRGWLNEKNEKEFKKTIKNSFCKKGDLIWDTVLSIEDYDTAELRNLKNADDYMVCLSKILPEFFKSCGFDPDNMEYWANLHTDKAHPHIHLVFFEKNKTRTKGLLPQKSLNKLKSSFVRETALRQEFQKKHGIDSKDFFKFCDKDKQRLLSNIKNRKLDHLSDVRKLYAKLPKTGRLSYNSYHMNKYRDELNQIIKRLLLSPGVCDQYKIWQDKVQQLEDLQNDYTMDKISNIMESEQSKLYTQIGNIILRNFKEYRKEKNTTKVKVPNSKIRFMDDKVALMKLTNTELKISQNMLNIVDDDFAEIDLNNDHYELIDTNNEIVEVEQEELIEVLKEHMQKENSTSTNMRMRFCGNQSRQVHQSLFNAGWNKEINRAIHEQIREKEHDLEVFLHGDKKRKERLI